MTLRQIFDIHGCDRGSLRHRYDRVYEPLFEPLRSQPLRILEIGVMRGGGIESWLRYFSLSRLVGLDTFKRIPLDMVAIRTHPRVELVKADSTKAQNPDIGAFDLIFDDGAHDPDSQLLTFHNYFSKLNPGGVYFIEDVNPDKHDCSELFAEVGQFHVKHHDLRTQQVPDSYILEVRP